MELKDAIQYVEVFLEYEKWYVHSGNDEDFLKGIDKKAIEKILEQVKNQEKMIQNTKDRIEYYLMGNSTLNDFTVREKELEKILKILNKADESE